MDELGLDIKGRDRHARIFALGDRHSPQAFTPALVQLADDPRLPVSLAPLKAVWDATSFPQTLTLKGRAMLSPPFDEQGPNWSTQSGRTLPPTLAEAAVDGQGSLGPLLTLSYGRLQADSRLSEIDPKIVVLIDAPQIAEDPTKLVAAIHMIRITWPSALLWAPGLGGADTLALLTWMGVDLVDLARLRIEASSGRVLDVSGSRAQAIGESVDPFVCSRAALAGEIHAVRAAILEGRMRTLVESRCSISSSMVEVLRAHDQLVSAHPNLPVDRVSRQSRQCIFSGSESVNDPLVIDWHKRIAKYRPLASQSQAMVLLPCSQVKPYSRSPSHRRFRNALRHRSIGEIMVTSPLGLVPRELEDLWPAAHYDVPVSGRWGGDEVGIIVDALKSRLAHDPPLIIIDHSGTPNLSHLLGVSRSFVEGEDVNAFSEKIRSKVQDGELVWIDTRQDASAGSRESMDRLLLASDATYVALDLVDPAGPQFVLDSLRSISRFQLGSDDWLREAFVVGRPPKWRISTKECVVAEWHPSAGRFAFRADGLLHLERHKALAVVDLKDGVKPRGDLFSAMISSAPDNVRSGDEVLLTQNSTLFGSARLSLSAWELGKVPGSQGRISRRIRR